MKHFGLGASIYVPSTRNDIVDIANQKKFKSRSVIFCTEDSVAEKDVDIALSNVDEMFSKIEKSEDMMKFVRVRNPEVFKKVIEMDKVDKIDGFVLPKVTKHTFERYVDIFNKSGLNKDLFYLMPTLETKEVFSINKMELLCQSFIRYINEGGNILSLRIGGNDLMHILGIRRSRYRTIYESPLSVTIANLVTIFKSEGFNVSAPVCEFLHDTELLKREVPLDLEYGLFGKTAIHPDQISIIENAYMPSEQDYEMAQKILNEDSPAVFGMHGTMCEKATHSKWASEIMERAKIYGIFGTKISSVNIQDK